MNCEREEERKKSIPKTWEWIVTKKKERSKKSKEIKE